VSDVTVKRVEEFDSPNTGGFCRVRAGLGVSAFGIQVEHFPPHFEHFPEHDHVADGQEEIYTAPTAPSPADGFGPAATLPRWASERARGREPPRTDASALLRTPPSGGCRRGTR
jgi:hypothetical protein